MKKIPVILSLLIYGLTTAVYAQQNSGKNGVVNRTYHGLPLTEISKNIGKKDVELTGRVFGTQNVGSTTLVYVGAPYPDQLFTIVLTGKPRSLYGKIDGTLISALGDITLYNNKPAIEVKQFGNLIFNYKRK